MNAETRNQLIEALKIISQKSPEASLQALKAIMAINSGSQIGHARFNNAAIAAMSDPQADFTPEERRLIASSVDFYAGLPESKTSMLRVRMTASEYAELEQMAAAAGISMSEYVRKALFE